MLDHCVRYRSGYKYQLSAPYRTCVRVSPTKSVKTEYISLTEDGALVLERGYAWDGPSGPTFDTKNFMRASLVHDALYQLMRLGRLEASCRKDIDCEMRRMCREDGMSRVRAWWTHAAVARFGDPAASPENRKAVHEAPTPCHPV